MTTDELALRLMWCDRSGLHRSSAERLYRELPEAERAAYRAEATRLLTPQETP